MRAILQLSLTLPWFYFGQAVVAGEEPKVSGKTLPEWVMALTAKDPNTRAEAAQNIGSLGRKAKSAVPALAKALKDDQPTVRLAAVLALNRMGDDAREATPALIEALSDKDLAATCLGLLEAIGEPAIPGLSKTLDHPKPAIAELAVRILSRIKHKDARAALSKALEHKDESIQVATAAFLWEAGERTDPLFQKIFDAMDSKDPSVRKKALARFDVLRSDGAPRLVKLLEDKDVSVRRRAMFMLKNFSNSTVIDAVRVTAALKDTDAEVRMMAVESLALMSLPGQPGLIEAVKAPDPQIRAKAIALMRRAYGLKTPEEAMPAIAAALDDPSSMVRLEAAYALEARDKKVDLLLDRFALALKDKEPEVRRQAMHYLADFYQPKAKSTLADRVQKLMDEALQDKDVGVRVAVVGTRVMRKFKFSAAESAEFVPILIEGLGDKNGATRFTAITALERIGSGAAPAVDALAKALSHDDERVRHMAIQTLGKIGPASKAAVPALAKALEHANGETRVLAAQALAKLGPDAAAAIPALIKSLKDQHDPVRMRAADALGSIGPTAKDAAVPLEQLQEDANPLVRNAAIRALASIRSKSKK